MRDCPNTDNMKSRSLLGVESTTEKNQVLENEHSTNERGSSHGNQDVTEGSKCLLFITCHDSKREEAYLEKQLGLTREPTDDKSVMEVEDEGQCKQLLLKENEASATNDNPTTAMEMCGRERLRRHTVEVAGRIWVPDIWGQEELLKDWIDCSAFDSSLFPSEIMSARAALVEEGRRANSGRLLTVQNRFN